MIFLEKPDSVYRILRDTVSGIRDNERQILRAQRCRLDSRLSALRNSCALSDCEKLPLKQLSEVCIGTAAEDHNIFRSGQIVRSLFQHLFIQQICRLTNTLHLQFFDIFSDRIETVLFLKRYIKINCIFILFLVIHLGNVILHKFFPAIIPHCLCKPDNRRFRCKRLFCNLSHSILIQLILLLQNKLPHRMTGIGVSHHGFFYFLK